MNLTHVRPRSTKGKTVGTLLCSALAFTLLLFVVETVDAQAIGPQAYRLIGTIQSKDFIGAVFSDSKDEQSFYRLHEKLSDGMQIVAVRGDSISLKDESGARFELYINHDIKTVGVANQSAHIEHPPPGSAITNVKPVQKMSRSEKQRLNLEEE
jgi:hypothetical protein